MLWSCCVCDAPMTDSHPSTRTGREATQLTDTGSPYLTTTLEGDISREQLSPDTEETRHNIINISLIKCRFLYYTNVIYTPSNHSTYKHTFAKADNRFF